MQGKDVFEEMLSVLATIFTDAVKTSIWLNKNHKNTDISSPKISIGKLSSFTDLYRDFTDFATIFHSVK